MENSNTENLAKILDAVESVSEIFAEKLSENAALISDNAEYEGKVTDEKAAQALKSSQALLAAKKEFIVGASALQKTFGEQMQGLIADAQAVIDNPVPATTSETDAATVTASLAADSDEGTSEPADINEDDIPEVDFSGIDLSDVVKDGGSEDTNVVHINAEANNEAETEPSLDAIAEETVNGGGGGFMGFGKRT